MHFHSARDNVRQFRMQVRPNSRLKSSLSNKWFKSHKSVRICIPWIEPWHIRPVRLWDIVYCRLRNHSIPTKPLLSMHFLPQDTWWHILAWREISRVPSKSYRKRRMSNTLEHSDRLSERLAWPNLTHLTSHIKRIVPSLSKGKRALKPRRLS